MTVRYDPEVDALSIRLKSATVETSDEIQEGVILDYGPDGAIIGVDILDASERVDDPMKVEVITFRTPALA